MEEKLLPVLDTELYAYHCLLTRIFLIYFLTLNKLYGNIVEPCFLSSIHITLESFDSDILNSFTVQHCIVTNCLFFATLPNSSS